MKKIKLNDLYEDIINIDIDVSIDNTAGDEKANRPLLSAIHVQINEVPGKKSTTLTINLKVVSILIVGGLVGLVIMQLIE